MRIAEIQRETKETQITARLSLEGSGQAQIETGIGFLDHMLTLFTFHARFDLELEAKGDLEVDPHHTVEDCALVLGSALDKALGDRSGITRMGHAYVPMDDSLARVVVDLSGRPYNVFSVDWGTAMLGILPASLIEHFFHSLAVNARANLHSQVFYGKDDHHKAEALFKALGRSLREAVVFDPAFGDQPPSTKGSL
jgi:imidazoleglycerol-phosphate dehydratase